MNNGTSYQDRVNAKIHGQCCMMHGLHRKKKPTLVIQEEGRSISTKKQKRTLVKEGKIVPHYQYGAQNCVCWIEMKISWMNDQPWREWDKGVLIMIVMDYHPMLKRNILRSLGNLEGIQYGSVWVTLKNQHEIWDSMIRKKDKTAVVNVWVYQYITVKLDVPNGFRIAITES